MWAILSARIPEWLILAETNLWEYFEDVRIGDGGAPGGKSWVDEVCRLGKYVEAKEDKQQLERKNTDDNEINQECIFALFYRLANS